MENLLLEDKDIFTQNSLADFSKVWHTDSEWWINIVDFYRSCLRERNLSCGFVYRKVSVVVFQNDVYIIGTAANVEE